MKQLKYVATGTGRSGSVFVAKLLTSVGVPCGHEAVFNRFGLDRARYLLSNPCEIRTSLVSGDSWLPPGEIEADSSYMAAPYLGSDLLMGAGVIHAVRHPIRVISSFVNALGYFRGPKYGTHYEKFIYTIIPDLYGEMTQAERACVFYVRWNEMIERAGGFRFRVEDNSAALLDFLGVVPSKPDLMFKDRKANTMNNKKPLIRLRDIPEGGVKNRFLAMGERYGYNMDVKLKVF